MDNEEIPWSKPFKMRGFWNWFFLCGTTMNPHALLKREYRRIVYCPHCDEKLEIAKYTRKGTTVLCCVCDKPFRFKPSYE